MNFYQKYVFSYYVEQKTFIEASCTNNKLTGENVFHSFYFKGL